MYGLSLSRRSESGEGSLYRFGFSYRLIKKIKSDNSVFILTFISLFFIIICFSSLLYLVTDWDCFLTAALYLSVISVFALIACISWIVLPAVLVTFIKKDNVAKIPWRQEWLGLF